MNLALDAAQEAFRREVGAFLDEWRGLDGYFHQDRAWPRVRAFFRALGERGWLALAWPREEGGLGRGPVEEFLLWDEIAYRRLARPPLGAGLVAKTILRAGDAAQKARWLPPLARGEIHFSLGYSEPEAGSDLAAVRTRAERRGDVYVVRGEKCWTSYAQHADFLWLLCRTGTQESRGGGLTLLVLDLRAPGVCVTPLPTVDGEQLHAISLGGVEVPAERRIGPEGGAWRLMAQALADERHVQFPPRRLRRDLEELAAWLRARGLAGDALARRRLAALAVEVLEVEALALRVVEAAAKGRSAAVEAAANKLAHTACAQRIADAALDLGGPEALAGDEPLELLWRQSLWETIGGGTSEMMRSVVARHGLGLGGRA